MATQTLVLLGDSILDNSSYTRPTPDTTAHLQRLLPDWSVQRCAMDGATMSDVAFQLRALAQRPTLAVLSIGGNDAAEHIGLLQKRVPTSAEVLRDLLVIADDFAARYEEVARKVRARAERAVLCTIYEVQLEPEVFTRLVRVPLALLNDRIVRIGSRLGMDVLELRSVCTEPDDFVLQIEPSARGAEKIARAIAGMISGDGTLTSNRIFAAGRDAFISRPER
jgi:lysophospholipase L1-like esterase